MTFLRVMDELRMQVMSINCLCCAVLSKAQSCPSLYDPMDSSLPGSSVHAVSPGKYTGVGCNALLQEKLLVRKKKKNKDRETFDGALFTQMH